LIARTEGSPFFLEESVQTLMETGVLVGTPGAYRLAMPLEGLQVPATVHAVLAARIDRLPPEEKRLLQTAAVIGTEVPLPLLQAVADMPEAALHHRLAHWQAAEFLYETWLFPEQVYTFKHALTHEVAYGSLLLERRRGLHGRLVEAIEALAPDRGTEQIERLAYHALRGEVWDKAVNYCQQAGTRAQDRAAFREAVASFEQALQALAHLLEDGVTRGLAIDLRLALGGALHILGEYGKCLILWDEAEALAQALDDWGRLAWVLAGMAQVRRNTGDHNGAIAAGQQAFELAAVLGESALQVQATHHLGMACYAIGNFSQAAERAAAAERGGCREGARQAHSSLSDRVPGVAGTDLERARSICRGPAPRGGGAPPCHAGRPKAHINHCPRLPRLPVPRPRGPGARHPDVRPGPGPLSCIRRADQFAIDPVGGLGYASALHGRLAEGLALLEETISVSIRTGGLQNHSMRVAWLSEVCRLAGRGEEAWQHAYQALDLALQHRERANEALALHQLGLVHAHAGPPDVAQAEAHYQQAMALAEALGMRPLVVHCHLGLGRLYHQTGRAEQARAALALAIDLYRALDMTFWLPQAEAALARVA
jgi:tetratricopeptide (TPR) repeat protein